MDALHREMAAADVYWEQTATKAGKASLHKKSFKLSSKRGGGTGELTDESSVSAKFESNAKSHRYGFEDLQDAKDFRRKNPKTSGSTGIVRLFKGNVPLEQDRDF